VLLYAVGTRGVQDILRPSTHFEPSEAASSCRAVRNISFACCHTSLLREKSKIEPPFGSLHATVAQCRRRQRPVRLRQGGWPIGSIARRLATIVFSQRRVPAGSRTNGPSLFMMMAFAGLRLRCRRRIGQRGSARMPPKRFLRGDTICLITCGSGYAGPSKLFGAQAERPVVRAGSSRR
jgi:hypothetical protein